MGYYNTDGWRNILIGHVYLYGDITIQHNVVLVTCRRRGGRCACSLVYIREQGPYARWLWTMFKVLNYIYLIIITVMSYVFLRYTDRAVDERTRSFSFCPFGARGSGGSGRGSGRVSNA